MFCPVEILFSVQFFSSFHNLNFYKFVEGVLCSCFYWKTFEFLQCKNIYYFANSDVEQQNPLDSHTILSYLFFTGYVLRYCHFVMK